MAIGCFSTPIFFEGMSAEIYPMKTDGVGYPRRSRESDESYVSCNSLVPWVRGCLIGIDVLRTAVIEPSFRRLMFVLLIIRSFVFRIFFFDLVAGYRFPLLTGSVPLSVKLLMHEDSLWGKFSLWKCAALMFGSNQLLFVSRRVRERLRVVGY